MGSPHLMLLGNWPEPVIVGSVEMIVLYTVFSFENVHSFAFNLSLVTTIKGQGDYRQQILSWRN